MTTITFKGTPTTLAGTFPTVGTKAPDFTITKTDLGELHLSDYLGSKRLVLNIFPSLDTPICSSVMKHFMELAKSFPEVSFLCISADLPFAQDRFCSPKSLPNVTPGSIFRHPDFGKKYGVEMLDGPLLGLLARAIIIIDENGMIAYTQLVQEISDEPDYKSIEKALSAGK